MLPKGTKYSAEASVDLCKIDYHVSGKVYLYKMDMQHV